MDQSILDYLSGKVSFSSWLESHAANLEFAEAILGPGQAPVIATNTATACTHQFSIATNAEADIRSGSVATAVQAFPSTPMIRGEQYGQMLDSASTGEQEKNELHASCPEPRSLLSGLSQEGDRPSRGSLLTIDPSSIQTDIPFSVLKPETQLREDGGEEVEEALNDTEVDGMETFDEMYPRYSQQTTPNFAVPTIHDSNVGLEEHQQGEALLPVIKRMSELMPSIAEARKTEKQSPPKKRSTVASVDDIFDDFLQPKKRMLKKRGPASHKLPEDLRKQMGVANLHVAKGQFDEAVNVCMEIVRQVPHNPHPFRTLALIYDEKGDSEKSLQYSLISAFLGCRDSMEWRDLANRCLKAGDRKQAIICLQRACKMDPKNLVLQWEKASLHFESQEYKKALDCYQAIFKEIPSTEGQKLMDLGKDIAKLYHLTEQPEMAVETMETVFKQHPEHIDSEGLNILAELFIALRNFKKAVVAICSHGGVALPGIKDLFDDQESRTPEKIDRFAALNFSKETLSSISRLTQSTISEKDNEFTSKFTQGLLQDDKGSNVESTSTDVNLPPGGTSWMSFLLTTPTKPGASAGNSTFQSPAKEFLNLDSQSKSKMQEGDVKFKVSEEKNKEICIPEYLPIDIRVKLAISLIQLERKVNIQEILGPMFEEDPENIGDLYLDVAEAYMEVGRHEEALVYLQTIVMTEKYDMAGVWLKLAECQQTTCDLESAAVSYYKVIERAPHQLNARLEVSNVLRRLGRMDEAVQVLSDEQEESKGGIDDEGDEIEAPHSKDAPASIKKEDMRLLYQKCSIYCSQGDMQNLAEYGYTLLLNFFKSAPHTRDEDGISKAAMWEIFVKVIQAMAKLRRGDNAATLLDKAIDFRAYSDTRRYRVEIDYVGATMYYVLGNFDKAFDMFRWIIFRGEEYTMNHPNVWNLYTRIVARMNDRKHHKYLLRLLFKHSNVIPLIMHNGHNAFLCGSYKYALGEYIRAFRLRPLDPLISLCIACTYVHLACQRFTRHRHTLVLHGIIFMFTYFNMRGKNQEAYYNLGRVFHQVGLNHFAVYYYNKALEFPLHNEQYGGEGEIEYSDYHDLHREAAYNLAFIYKSSGNEELARRTLYRYCWV